MLSTASIQQSFKADTGASQNFLGKHDNAVAAHKIPTILKLFVAQNDYKYKQATGQWDFQGPPIMGPPYGKLPILLPYHSHKNP